MHRAIKTFILLWIFFAELHAIDFSLRDKFARAQVGDYIVTEQDKNYSILLIKDKQDQLITFEEISFPENSIQPKKTSWQTYLNQQAPQHSSWILFEMSLLTGEIIECYSISQRSWITFEDMEHFLSKFFCLPFAEVESKDRKRVRPPPKDHEDDHRSLWAPPLFIEGKKKEKPLFSVHRAKWTQDGSLLSNCNIEMFFYEDDPLYPFPIWIEVNNGHYGFKIRAQDTGRGLQSPYQRAMPKRPPLVAGGFTWYKESLEIPIKCPSYAKTFNVEMIDISEPYFRRIPVPHELIHTDKKELYMLKFSKQALQEKLKNGHRYRLSMIPAKQNAVCIESEESFLLP